MASSARSSRQESLNLPMNNGKRRRQLKREEKVLGRKLAYNEDVNRAQFRAMANEPIDCPDCGVHILRKNYAEHVRVAMLHAKKRKKD